MDQKSRKSIYEVVHIYKDGDRKIFVTNNKDFAIFKYMENKDNPIYSTVLFCTTTPTVTKGQIDPDLY